MDHRANKIPYFDGTNYPYWKVRMRAYLLSIGALVWEIVENQGYEVLAARVGQEQIDQHEANSKAVNALFSSLSLAEFERVSHFRVAREIWSTLERFHEGTPHVKTRVFDTYRREYENFVHMPGETIDSMFSRFQVIVNKMRANMGTRIEFPYTDHERAIKLLEALDPKVWETKVAAITESDGYETLTTEELFSKLKASEINLQTRAKLANPSGPSIALVSGMGGSSSSADPTSFSFSSALLSVTVGDDYMIIITANYDLEREN